MDNVTILFINTPWRAQSHQWILDDDGLVEYRGELVTPLHVVENFESDYPMFRMLRAEVCERIIDEAAERPYQWVTLERYF